MASLKIPKNVANNYVPLSTINAFPVEAAQPGATFSTDRDQKNWRATPEYIASHIAMGPAPSYAPMVSFDVVVPPATPDGDFTFGKAYLSPQEASTLNVPPAGYIFPPGVQAPPVEFTPVDLSKIPQGYVVTTSFMAGVWVLYNMNAAPPTPVPGTNFPQEALDILRRLGRWMDAQGFPQ